MPVSSEVTLDDAMELAAQHHAAGNLVLADRTYRDILKALPAYYPAMHYLGVVAYQRGNMEEALQLIEKAVESDPENVDYLNNYAIVLSDSGQKEKSLAFWDKTIAADAGHAHTYSNKANTLWELKRYEEAATFARKALDLDPDLTDALLNLGNALVAQGQIAEAVKYWQKAVTLDENYDKGWNNLGNALRDMGKIRDSEEACRKAVAINPKAAAGWNNLGNALRDQGRPKEAEDCYRKATSRQPDYAEAHNNLAVALLDQSRMLEAAESAKLATAFKSDYAEAFGNLSVALREMGEMEEAETAAQRAVAIQPDSAAAYLDLADILFLSDRYDEAEAALKEARDLEPDSPRVYAKLSSVLERVNRNGEALEAIDKAIEHSPEMPDLYSRKSAIYFINNEPEKAIEQIDKALALKPDFLPALASLAEIQQSLGEMTESVATIRKGLALNDRLPAFYMSLAKTKKFTKDDKDFQKMQELEQDAHTTGRLGACALHYALFKAYEDIGDDEKAFAHLKAGNDLKRKTVPYDHESQTMIFEQVKARFVPEFFKTMEGKGHDSDCPVFIVGMPRSGTTLTEQIISSHPDVFGAGELATLSVVEQTFGNFDTENAAEFGKAYVDQVMARFQEARDVRHFTDKMPGNFIRVGQIASVLPQAKIIHCRRNAADTCLSCYKQLFARGQYWSYDLEELAAQHNAYRDIMAHWRDVLPGRFLEVDYEDTVNDLEAQARRMIAFIGLDWHDACLAPHKQKRSILTASKTQVIKPVYTSSVAGWKRYEKQLQPLLETLQEEQGDPNRKHVEPP